MAELYDGKVEELKKLGMSVECIKFFHGVTICASWRNGNERQSRSCVISNADIKNGEFAAIDNVIRDFKNSFKTSSPKKKK